MLAISEITGLSLNIQTCSRKSSMLKCHKKGAVLIQKLLCMIQKIFTFLNHVIYDAFFSLFKYDVAAVLQKTLITAYFTTLSLPNVIYDVKIIFQGFILLRKAK